MISVKSRSELEKMRKAGIIAGNALHFGGQSIKVGMTTYELDKIIHDYIVKHGATPSFLGYGGFPASACISINNKVIHGIPSKHEHIKDGISPHLRVGTEHNGVQNRIGVFLLSCVPLRYALPGPFSALSSFLVLRPLGG